MLAGGNTCVKFGEFLPHLFHGFLMGNPKRVWIVRLAESLGDDTGIVDQYVEAARLFDDSVDRRLPVDLAGDIELDGLDAGVAGGVRPGRRLTRDQA